MSDYDAELIWASARGQLAEVQAHLARGADVESDGNEALKLASMRGHVDVVQCLLAAGADLHTDNELALRWAAEYGQLGVVQCLLAAGAEVHAQDDEALQLAYEREHPETFQCLLWAGGNVPPAVDADFQVKACAFGDPADVFADDLARQGVCPEALCVLLGRQGYAELAAMLRATKLMKPLDPSDRAELLADLLKRQAEPEMANVGP